MNKTIMCIDLKSFFASCECVDKGLDPYTTPLVVASSSQGPGAITLAITPYLKSKGIKSRSRLFEIPPYIKYTIVPPRMGLYRNFSQKVIDVYLEFVSIDDLHAYSIDECFLDLTNYMKLYKKSDLELAKCILDRIKIKTGLTASCGIGSNPFFAKVAMDTEAKNNKHSIAKWDYENYKKHLHKINKLTNIWGLGPKFEKKLNNYGIFTVKEFMESDKATLKNKFGLVASELHDYLNGHDNRTIKSMKESVAVDKSYSLSQTFFTDYDYDNSKIIINELSEVLAQKLRKNSKETTTINLKVSYSREINKSFNKSISLLHPTDNYDLIKETAILIFEQLYEDYPIRKIELHLYNLTEKLGTQLNLFENKEVILEKNNINSTLDNIRNKYGTNVINRASSLLDGSNIKNYNQKHEQKKLEPKVKF